VQDNRNQDPETVGFRVGPQGEVDALILDNETLLSLFPEDAEAWTTMHDPTITLTGDGSDWDGFADLDLDEMLTAPTDENGLTEAGEAIFVNQSRESSFFVQQRLNREQNRSSERSVLNDLINNDNVSEEQRATAAGNMIEIQRRIGLETAAEALIEAKGFAEVYVRIADNSVDVIVSKDTLEPAEIATIMEIIKRKTGMNETQIHISPLRR